MGADEREPGNALREGGGLRAVVSKRGVDDGNQKGGGSLQPAKENRLYYTRKYQEVKK